MMKGLILNISHYVIQYIVAGQLGRERIAWENIISRCDMDAKILSFLRELLFEGVYVVIFFLHFIGKR